MCNGNDSMDLVAMTVTQLLEPKSDEKDIFVTQIAMITSECAFAVIQQQIANQHFKQLDEDHDEDKWQLLH
ncbi:unnamed protein product [Peronospora belbahrii]|uniref:Uncharacterized protein n=1 Tax=Peronospora belbahrii TaxID=622444 RepID=A0AAU9KZM1_9STRA|nr:unnamed protein product [Peronospora belbahrii]